MALKQNISIDQGSDFSIEFDVTDASDDPIDFSTHEISAQLRKHFESSNSTSFSCSGYSNGAILIALTSDQTVLLTPGRYMYDVIADNSGTKSRIVEGIATINPLITK